MKESIIIGIAGPSSSGKTSLGKALKKLLRDSKIIHVDDYWKDRDSIPKSFNKWKEWERPSSINFKKLYEDLIFLKNKKLYSIIIIEGFYLFYNKKIREIIDLKIYLHIPNNLIIKRRIGKFGHENNQRKYSKEIVIKEYKKYGELTKKYADLIFSGTKPINEVIKIIKNKYLIKNYIKWRKN